MKTLDYKKTYLIGLLLIAAGIVINCNTSDVFMNLGTVLVAVGCLFLISGMAKKNKK
jgi:uncharacterized membrane protein HdeD (DUF308 family)